MAVQTAADSIRRGLRWWKRELVELFPVLGWSASRGQADVLVIDVSAARVSALSCAKGACSELATAARPGAVPGADVGGDVALDLKSLAGAVDPVVTPVVVRVAPEEVLTRVVTLPAAAKENLRDVLAFEMHRQTPFTVDEVYFDFRLRDAAPAADHVQVELAVVRRGVVDTALALLPDWELAVAGGAELSGIDRGGLLLRLQSPQAGRTARRILPRLLLATNVALLVAAVVIPLLQQRDQIHALRELVAAAKVEAESVAALRGQAERLRAERRFLIEAKRDRPAMVEMITWLTASIPDTTWVQRLEVRSDEVRLSGTSSTASSLIPIIEDSPLFRRASFSAPVTRNPATGMEQFQLVFEIARPGEADETDRVPDIQKSAGAVAAAAGLARGR